MKPPASIVLAVLFGLGVAPVWADSLHDKISEGLPRYNPEVRAETAVREEAAAADETPVAQRSPLAAPSILAPANTRPVLLPEVIVTTAKPKEERPTTLPRIETRPAPGKVRLEPFLTPEERDARLEEKHLSALDRKVLNRITLPLFGVSRKERAGEAEAIERSARGLNEVADRIEAAAASGADREYLRQLETIYYQMYVSRPK